MKQQLSQKSSAFIVCQWALLWYGCLFPPNSDFDILLPRLMQVGAEGSGKRQNVEGSNLRNVVSSLW